MSIIPVHTSYTTWTVEELIDATSANPYGNKKVTIPEFQRRLVWTKKKQEGLIDSIKKGFPFGSLLLYEVKDNEGLVENYKLIDGLQRTQTLRRYSSQPNILFSKSDLSDDFIDTVAKEINPYSDLDCLSAKNKGKISRSILEWIWDSRGFTESKGWGISSLTDALLIKVLELEAEEGEFYRTHKNLSAAGSEYRLRIDQFLAAVQRKTDIDKVKVPVIIYSGPSSLLSTVFVLLNSEGIQLSRYEIYAALWLDQRYKIENTDIIDAIWKKYKTLEDVGFSLDVALEAPDAKSRIDREYTLFEYLFGLGQYLSANYKHFFKPVEVDQPSPFGFNLVSACISGSVSETIVRNLPENIRGLSLSSLEDSLLESVDFVYELLKPVLSAQRSGQSRIPYFHADLQIVSMIAAAFRVRYSYNDLSEIEGWRAKRETLKINLPMFYLQDILQKSWTGSGHSRLAEILKDENYLAPPPSESIWSQVLNLWFDSNLSDRQHEKKYIKDDLPEYLLLRYIMIHKLSADTPYHVQHLIPISRLLSPPSYYHDNNGPINTIGNLALVSEENYQEFGNSTFVEYFNSRMRSTDHLSDESQYDDALNHALNERRNAFENLLLCNADILPPELTQDAFERFLRRRFELLKAEFIRVWRNHIPADPPALAPPPP